jgi:D-aminopeptidase
MSRPDERLRVRDLGVLIGGHAPGAHNAITDVPGVEVGQTTVHWGEPDLPPGAGPARTGVTAIWPARDVLVNPVAAGCFVLSGAGELTDRSEIEELGQIGTPIALTGTMQVGLVYDAICRYVIERMPGAGAERGVLIPVVAECDDSYLHDARGFHLTHEHVYAALDGATGGPVAEGCVGGGTGMVCFHRKGGIGTSSRLLPAGQGGWTVGALVMTNFGRRPLLTFAGVPLGRYLPATPNEQPVPSDRGSCIVVVATDAPLDGRQLARVARRAALGLGRTLKPPGVH